MIGKIAASLVSGIMVASLAAAQDPPATLRTFEELTRTLPQAAAADALQIRVRWRLDRPLVDPADADNRFDVIAVTRVTPGPSRDRRPEVNTQHIVAISRDAGGAELDWRAIVDPRLVRSESQDGAELRGESLYYLDTELVLVVPALPATATISLYKVVVRDGVPALRAFGQIRVPAAALP